jgi:hypothetical protein
VASPVVVGTGSETAVATASTSHVVNLPGGTTGNLFLAVMSKGSAGTTPSVNTLTGWNELLDEAIVLGLYIAWRSVDGTEGATTTFTLSSATRGAWIVYEISGMDDPNTQPPEIGTTATGSSVNPDPPSVSVTGGSKDILTIAMFGRAGEEADDDTWTSAAPSGFTGLLQKACGVAGSNLAGMVATAELASTTDTSDPDTFTCVTGAWRAQTIVVHPAVSTDHTVDVDDDVSLTDQLLRAVGINRAFDDTVDPADQLSRAVVMARSISDTVDLADDTSVLNVPSGPPPIVVETFAPRRTRKGRRISW